MEDNIGEEYNNYWETTMFFQSEELDRSWGLEEAISGYYDSSSPDNGASSVAVSSKNKVSEKNRRKKLNDRLFALRAVVPNISKMDKASIVKDAIDHIKDLHEQERRIQAEIAELESEKSRNTATFKLETDSTVWRPKKKRIDQFCDPHMSISSPIEVLELRVSYVGVRTVLVSLSCSKRKDTIVKLCEAFETLKLKIITATITAFSGSLLKTVFVQADEEEQDELKMRIEAAIAALDDPESPMSI